MSRHRILCASLEAPANPRDTPHPVRVGVGSPADPARLERFWSAQEVAAAIAQGAAFYTRQPLARGEGTVFAQECRMCGRTVLRSGPEAEEANRLERLPKCP
jgi:hypothetical protein